jgi:hypothetical protein
VVKFAVSGKFAAPSAHIERALLFTWSQWKTKKVQLNIFNLCFPFFSLTVEVFASFPKFASTWC